MVANETKVVVQREETEATKKATETQAIADDAQRDLDEALPALVSASLNQTLAIQLTLSSPSSELTTAQPRVLRAKRTYLISINKVIRLNILGSCSHQPQVTQQK